MITYYHGIPYQSVFQVYLEISFGIEKMSLLSLSVKHKYIWYIFSMSEKNSKLHVYLSAVTLSLIFLWCSVTNIASQTSKFYSAITKRFLPDLSGFADRRCLFLNANGLWWIITYTVNWVSCCMSHVIVQRYCCVFFTNG